MEAMDLFWVWLICAVVSFAIRAYKQGIKSHGFPIDYADVIVDFALSVIWPIMLVWNLIILLYLAIAYLGDNISYWRS